MKLVTFLAIVTAPATAGSADDSYRLDGGEILTLFVVTLGPLKILGPFARLTRGAPLAQVRRLAWQATGIAAFALLVGGFLGRGVLVNWQIPTPVLELTAGIVFFVVALRAVLAQYEDPTPPSLPPEPLPSPLAVAFPLVVTPYGMAAVITLLALSHGIERTGLVLGMLVVVMLANLAAMVWVRHLLTPAGVTILRVLGAVLGILQVALAVRILLGALARLGLLASS